MSVTFCLPQFKAFVLLLPIKISILFLHRLFILSLTRYNPGSPLILTTEFLFRPILSKSLDTAITFIPIFSLSPHAPMSGVLSVCAGSELYAVAVTSNFTIFAFKLMLKSNKKITKEIDLRFN